MRVCVPQEGQTLLCGSHGGRPQVEGVLQELEGLWEELQRRHRENGAALKEIDKVRGAICLCQA